jgi:hypothetical protein
VSNKYEHLCKQGCTANDTQFELLLVTPLGDTGKVGNYKCMFVQKIAALLLFAIPLISGCGNRTKATAPVSEPKLTIKSIQDPLFAGEIFKIGHQVFEVIDGDCAIRWSVFTYKTANSPIHLDIHAQCARDLTHQIPIHQSILETILRQYSKEKMDTFSTAIFPIWEERMALASLNSAEWKAALAVSKKGHAPNENGLFIAVFNKNNVGSEFSQLFAKHGLAFKMVRAEKTLVSKANKLPFADKIPDLKASEIKVMFSAFAIKFKFTRRANVRER